MQYDTGHISVSVNEQEHRKQKEMVEAHDVPFYRSEREAMGADFFLNTAVIQSCQWSKKIK